MPLIDVGKKAPAFSLKDQDGATHALKDYLGSPLVIFFYPEDDTPVCTKQACQFRDLRPKYDKLGVPVLGVSPQDEASKARFAAKHELNFTLLADAKRNKDGNPVVCDRFGVWGEKNMYGNIVVGILRTTYLIDADGRVAKRWDRVRTPGHAEKVLEAIRALA